MRYKVKVFFGILAMAVIFSAMSTTGFAEPEDKGDNQLPHEHVFEEGTLEYVLYNGLINMDETIELTNFNFTWEDLEEIDNTYKQVINDSPELFYVLCFYDYAIGEDMETDMESIVGIYPVYLAKKEDVESRKETFQLAVKEALSGVEDSMSDLEKALYLHDYIVRNCEYDWINQQKGTIPDESFTAYGCLVNGKAVSDGYTLAYAYLLHEVGIETEFISGWSQSWNAVMLDGKYYFVDLIWDDPIRYKDSGGCFDYVGHDYFLVTAGEILDEDIGYHMGWTQDIDVTDTTYSRAPFRKVDSPFCYYKGEWYYWYNQDNNYKKPVIAKTADPMVAGTPIHSLSDLKWYTYENNEKAWKGYQENVDVSIERGILYYCTPSQIFSINLEDLSEAPRLLYTIDTTNGYLYGLRVDKDVLSYGISTSPYEKETWLTYNLNTEIPEYFTGDVDKNGVIDANDALGILKSVVGLENPDYDEWFADFDGNSSINANDALLILKKVVGIL